MTPGEGLVFTFCCCAPHSHTKTDEQHTKLLRVQIKKYDPYLKDKHHACNHGVHVILAHLFAQSSAHGSQGLQILPQDLFAHVGQHL